LPVAPPTDSVAASEISLYRNVLNQKGHELEDLGISFWTRRRTIQWSYNADHYFHAASTMKLAVLLGVFREIDRGTLALDSPSTCATASPASSTEPFMLDLGRDAIPTSTAISARRSRLKSWRIG